MFVSTLKKKIPLLFLLIFLYYTIKPSITFKPNGKSRVYGFGTDTEGYRKTLYTMQNIIIVIVVIVHFCIKSPSVIPSVIV